MVIEIIKKGILNNMVILLILSILLVNSVFGQDTQDTVYKNNIVPSPAFAYAPETDVVIGLFALYQFKFKKSDQITRPSFLMLYASTSFNNQFTSSFEHSMFIPPLNKMYFKGIIEYKNWPELYFGIGPTTLNADLLISEYNIFLIDQRGYKNFGKNFFVGLQAKYFNFYNVQFQDEDGNDVPAPQDIYGADGGSYFGPGVGIVKDERNSILTPTTDYYLEFSTFFYSKALGSTSTFSSYLIDARKYFDFKSEGKRVLAFQGKALFTAGDVPFMELAKMGGKFIMRGFLEGRYRDNQYFQLQAEYRATIIGRFGATAFAGTGNVMPKVTQFQISTVKAAVGFGLRFDINRKDPANIRIDFGYGFEKNAKGVYITFGEAF